MVLESVLYGVLGSIITWLVVLWTLITFRHAIARRLWKGTFRDLMWLSFAEAQEELEDGELPGGMTMGDVDAEDVPFAKYLPIIDMLSQLDGADLSNISGTEAAELGTQAGGVVSQFEGWN